MFRSIPVFNKICFDKQLKRNWKIHEHKLIQIKSKFAKQRSPQFSFLQQSKKRSVLRDIQNREIQRSNHILFKKIQEIQTKGNKCSYLQMQKIKQKEKSSISMNCTLHEPFRKKQMFRIVQENQQMLKRIKQKKSTYNVRHMQRQRKNIEKNISLISEFKYKNYPQTHTRVNFYMKDQDRLQQGSSRITNCRNQSTIDASNCEPSYKKTTKGKVCARHTCFSQTSKELNNRHFIITTYVHKDVFYVEVQDLQNQSQKYRMQMEEKKLYGMLQKFYNNNLAQLIDNLDIDQENQNCYLKFKKNLTQDQNKN